MDGNQDHGLRSEIQSEIGYCRVARGGLDVVVGEILPAMMGSRKPGGKGKAK